MKREMTPKGYLLKLLDGNRRFYTNDGYKEVDISKEKLFELKDEQNPFAIVASCSDSRITPTIIFNQGLGDLFEIRLAGNVLTREALGSIEYGVEATDSKVVMVLGHENCGAVKGAIDEVEGNETFRGDLKYILKKIKPSVTYVKKYIKEDIFINAVKMNIENTLTSIYKSEIIKEYVEIGRIILVGAIYYTDGKVEILNIISKEDTE